MEPLFTAVPLWVQFYTYIITLASISNKNFKQELYFKVSKQNAHPFCRKREMARVAILIRHRVKMAGTYRFSAEHKLETLLLSLLVSLVKLQLYLFSSLQVQCWFNLRAAGIASITNKISINIFFYVGRFVIRMLNLFFFLRFKVDSIKDNKIKIICWIKSL